MLDVSILDNKLRAAGVPIDGVGKDDVGNFRIDFAPGATQGQRDQAAAIVAAFDPNEVITRQQELDQAPRIAYQWFKDHPQAVSFIRLTPVQQEAAIDGYNTAQLKELLKFLTVAVGVLIKRELL